MCGCVCVCACAWAPADGMTHLDWAVLYLGMRACYIPLRSGWGSDGNVYIVLRGLNNFWKPCCGLAGHSLGSVDASAANHTQ